MFDVKRINKECFWEYSFSDKEILNFSKSDDFREKKFLFEKILLNSTEVLQDLEILKKNDIETLLKEFNIPAFNNDYIFKRKNIADVYFLDKELLVDELKWAV